MNLIEKLGLPMAEAIASCLLTTAKSPEYFCLDPKQYFCVVDGVVCFYHDKEQQFLEYKPLAECDFEYVSIADLRTALADHDSKPCSHGYDIACLICGFGTESGVRVWRKQIETDNVTDIRNHIPLNTKVIEHE